MKWVLIGLCLYLIAGISVATMQGKQLIIELSGDYYSSKDMVRFKVFLAVILVLSVLVWPIVLMRSEKKESQILYVIRDVSARFTNVSRDKREELEAMELSLITSKFITLYEQFGLKLYEEHLEYELAKYHEEGIREDYCG